MESFHDYTLATPWERFVAVIEQNFRSWLLTGLDALPKTKPGTKPTTHKIQAKLNHKLPWRREPYLLTLYVPPVDAGPSSLQSSQSMQPADSATSSTAGGTSAQAQTGGVDKMHDGAGLVPGKGVAASKTEPAPSPRLRSKFPAALQKGPVEGPGGPESTKEGAMGGPATMESLHSEEVFLDVEDGTEELNPEDMDRLLSELRNTDLQLHMISPRESIIDTESVAASEAPAVPDDARVASVSDSDTTDEEPAPLTTVPIHITDEKSAREARSKASQGRGIMKESRSWWPLRGRPRQWWRYSKQHRLQTWFGVDIFLLLEPASYSGRILDEKEANALLSALAVALQNTSISWPAFIPVHDALRDTFWGTASTCFGPVRFDTDSIHTSRTPQHLMELAGQLSLFAAQLRPYSPGASLYCQALANPYAVDCPSQQYEPCSVTLTCRQVYVLPVAVADEEDSGEEDSSWSSRWDDMAPWRPWASQKDPISLIELDVVWESVELQLGRQRPQLAPAAAHHWKLHVLQCGISTPHKSKGFMPKSTDRYRQQVQLQREGSDWLWSAGNASFYFHNSLIYARQHQAAEAGVDVGLSSFTAMLHALLSARGAASRASSMGEMVHAEWWEQRNAIVPPSPPERVMEDVLRDLFSPTSLPTLFKRDTLSSLMHLDFPGTAPSDCLLSCLAKHCLVFGNARAVAMLWSRFIQEVRFEHWDAVTLLPRLPSRLVQPAASSQPHSSDPSTLPDPRTPTRPVAKLPSIHQRGQPAQPSPLSCQDTSTASGFAQSLHATPTTPHASTPTGAPSSAAVNHALPVSTPPDPAGTVAQTPLHSSSLSPMEVSSSVRRTSSVPLTPGIGSRTAWSVNALEELKVELVGGGLGFARTGVMGGPPEPDLHTCLVHQKLQLLNVCIFRRNARRSSRRASLSPTPVVPSSNHDTAAGANSNLPTDRGSSEMNGWDFGSDDEFADAGPATSIASSSVAGSEYESCSDDEGMMVQSSRAGPASPGLCQVEANHTRIRAPETQEPPCLTADMLLAKQRLLSALADGSPDNHHLLLKLKAELLTSDIAAFKDANPDSDIHDFIAWQHAIGAQGPNNPSQLLRDISPEPSAAPPTTPPSSRATLTLPPIRSASVPVNNSSALTPNAPSTHVPPSPTRPHQPDYPTASDVVDDRSIGSGSNGRPMATTPPASRHKPIAVSAPLMHLWQATAPCAAEDQKPLLDVEREAEIVLHYLETVSPVSLFNQLFVVGVACAVGLLSQCKGAQLEVCRRKLEQFAGIMAPILERGSGLAEALDELERNGTVGSEGGERANGRPRGLDDAELEFVLAEFQVLEQVVVLAESLTRRLPGSPSVCNRILERMVQGSDEGDREPEGRFWSGCIITAEQEREEIWKLLSKGLKHNRSDPDPGMPPAWGVSDGQDHSWAHPSRAGEGSRHPHVAQREWVLECSMEHPRRCRPQRPVAQFDASGAHPPRCKHRLYVQEADSEMRLAMLLTNHGP